ncbi:hypothetical protein GUJ93_ZPchr0011g27033 [Zizania palustris]|uniref:Uncharacterized protein n=1 Tax=Zizania palustris TaxID=103762 RepID=A0A8J6BPL9_ZIZPA|nr:hypothetical protein GUJ93_ZPchr0011g27033 [Zizania palustris]
MSICDPRAAKAVCIYSSKEEEGWRVRFRHLLRLGQQTTDGTGRDGGRCRTQTGDSCLLHWNGTPAVVFSSLSFYIFLPSGDDAAVAVGCAAAGAICGREWPALAATRGLGK